MAEFLQLMQPRRAGNLWSNEDANLAAPAPGKKGQKAGAGEDGATLGKVGVRGAAKQPGQKRQADTVDSAGDDASPMHPLIRYLCFLLLCQADSGPSAHNKFRCAARDVLRLVCPVRGR